jgi:hypothetical protein
MNPCFTQPPRVELGASPECPRSAARHPFTASTMTDEDVDSDAGERTANNVMRREYPARDRLLAEYNRVVAKCHAALKSVHTYETVHDPNRGELFTPAAAPGRGGARGLPRKEQPVKSKEFGHVND